jgi:hypothetical protein
MPEKGQNQSIANLLNPRRLQWMQAITIIITPVAVEQLQINKHPLRLKHSGC